MIAKRVPRTLGKSNSSRLVKYMIAAKGEIDPNTWARTADYILDTVNSTHKGERVASHRVTNCGTDDAAAAAILIEATQASNTRSKTDKTYHLVYSFPPGETPSLDILHKIEDELCASIGYEDHQRISAVHIDTDHLHVHVAINKIHPIGLQNIEPYFDKKRLMQACENLEIKYSLQRTNHGLTQQQENQNDRIKLNPRTPRSTKFREYLRKSNNLSTSDIPEAKTLNSLRNLSGSRMARTPKRASMLLQNNARPGVEPGGKEFIEGLRWQRNGNRSDVSSSGNLSEPAKNMEQHSGVTTLTSYVAQNIKLDDIKNWQFFHALLAEHGLEIKKRGAGLVIGDNELGIWTKASSCNRAFSFNNLVTKLGTFEENKNKPQAPKQRYVPKPKQKHISSAALYSEYQREKQLKIANRKIGMEALKQENILKKEELKKWKARQYMLLKVAGKGPTKRLISATIKKQAQATQMAQREVMAAKRQKLFMESQSKTWLDWLAYKAETGNTDAIEILRSRSDREIKLRGDLLTVESAERAKNIVLKSLKPQVRKDGALTYRTIDGGLVIDRKTYIQSQKSTAGAALVTLEIASKKFIGQKLIVEGTQEFKNEIAKLAALHKFDLEFSDENMQKIYKNEINKRTDDKRTEKEKENISNINVYQRSIVNQWINKRNETRDKIETIEYNRLWTPDDVGNVIYKGRRKMIDGSEIILLKKGNEMLIKPVSERVAAKASKLKVGQPLKIDARGRITNNLKQIEK